MFNGQTAIGWGSIVSSSRKDVTVQAALRGTAAATVTASIDIYVSNSPQFLTDPTNAPKSLAGNITLTGTGAGVLAINPIADSAGFALQTRWRYIAAYLTSISGTGAAADCAQWADA